MGGGGPPSPPRSTVCNGSLPEHVQGKGGDGRVVLVSRSRASGMCMCSGFSRECQGTIAESRRNPSGILNIVNDFWHVQAYTGRTSKLCWNAQDVQLADWVEAGGCAKYGNGWGGMVWWSCAPRRGDEGELSPHGGGGGPPPPPPTIITLERFLGAGAAAAAGAVILPLLVLSY